MMENTNGFYRELIIHPGETLKEVLGDKGMSQGELAVRTGFTPKHISKVINGSNSISPKFAKSLEYALNIDASFWSNLQSEYDRELLEFEERENICDEEISILKNLKEILEYFIHQGIINEKYNKSIQVCEMRQFLGVNNLRFVPNLPLYAAFRGSKKQTVDPYVLCAWERMCVYKTMGIKTESELNKDLLKKKLSDIKRLMFVDDPNLMHKKLIEIFQECGIAFSIVRHFKGAPVQGFIQKVDNEKTILCMTIRQKYADIFWFTLFHEIAHLLHDDIKKQFSDFIFKDTLEERRADIFARNFLIEDDKYINFVSEENFSLGAINRFSNECGIKNYILIGRLQKDGYLDYTQYSDQKIRYDWS